MKLDLEKRVNLAIARNQWDYGNGILYRLCRSNPKHIEKEVVIAKIWLIGRGYAAAIERKRTNKEPDFYGKIVAPSMIGSDIDQWVTSLKSSKPGTEKAKIELLVAHAQLTKLFKKISGSEKRSLASKYLHFHCPHHAFIYDSRAVKGLSRLSKITGRVPSFNRVGDSEYRKFVEKCSVLRSHIQAECSKELTPRQLDNLLLSYAED